VYVEFISFCFRLTLDTRRYMIADNAIANTMQRMTLMGSALPTRAFAPSMSAEAFAPRAAAAALAVTSEVALAAALAAAPEVTVEADELTSEALAESESPAFPPELGPTVCISVAMF
jgi:hypothetical protein